MPNSLSELRMIDPVLTSISKAYSNSGFVWNLLFPTVQVSKAKIKVPVFGKDSFLERQTDRAVRADSNRIEPFTIGSAEFTTQEKDIEMAIDHLESEESLYGLRYEKQITKELSDIIALGKEKAAAELAQNPASYAAGSVETLAQADAFNNYTSGSDPIEIIKDSMATVRGLIGREPNTMVIGPDVARALYSHPRIIERIRYAGMAAATENILEKLLGINKIAIGKAVYSEDGSTFTDIWAGKAVLAYTEMNEKDRSEYTPSLGYTFQREGHPYIDTYMENGGKRKIIRATDHYGTGIVCREAAALITDAVQDLS